MSAIYTNTTVLNIGYNYNNTIRRPLDCSLNVIKVSDVIYISGRRPANRSHADLYVFVYTTVQQPAHTGRLVVVKKVVERS